MVVRILLYDTRMVKCILLDFLSRMAIFLKHLVKIKVIIILPNILVFSSVVHRHNFAFRNQQLQRFHLALELHRHGINEQFSSWPIYSIFHFWVSLDRKDWIQTLDHEHNLLLLHFLQLDPLYKIR